MSGPYMKVEVVASTPGGKFGLDDVKAIAETSANEKNLRPWRAPSPEAAKMEEIARKTNAPAPTGHRS